MVNILPVMAGATQKHIIEQFKSIGALSLEYAVPLEALQIDHNQYKLSRGEFSRMIQEGCIKQERGKYWLDLAARESSQRHVTKQALTILLLVLAILLLVLLLIFIL